MVGYKQFTSKISGKGHFVVLNDENGCVNAVTTVYHTESMDTDV